MRWGERTSIIYLQEKCQGKTTLNNEQMLKTMKDENVEMAMLRRGY
jgi:hypothetical protein